MNNSVFGFLQKIGKSLMLPVSVLPVAGILLGVGAAQFSWMPPAISEIMAQSGGAVFSNLALIFAIGVALGLAENDGVAALAAVVGYVVLLGTMGVMAKSVFGLETKTIMGIQSIETGVFGGILVGGLAGFSFNRFYRITLPPYLGFFAGKRSVPIITAFSSIGLGMVLSLCWPPLQGGIDHFSHWATEGNPLLMSFLYGIGERSLIPFGLHHIWNVPFFFEIGQYTNSAGQVVHGDITRFFAGDPTAGFLGGAFLFKMFGLPAAAIAIWHAAKPENKKAVGGVMISAALTSFLTGITEPIEFAFLFVAPVLYAIHALLAGFSFVIFYLFGAKLGTTFSHGLIDYVLYWGMNTKPYLVLVFGPLYAGVYYTVFRTIISKFNLKTPGREDNKLPSTSTANDQNELAQKLILALGGSSNILNLDACITRLRVTLKNISLADQEKIKLLGPAGIVKIGTSLQIIFGTSSDNIKTDMLQIMGNISKAPLFPENKVRPNLIISSANQDHSLDHFFSPMSGQLLPLNEVPDHVFSEKMLGDGFAIDPENGEVSSPVNGTVLHVFPTQHAIGILSDQGMEVLIHFGIDSVKLAGEGLKALVNTGDTVVIGQKIMSVDIEKIKNKIPSLITPVVFTNLKKNQKIVLSHLGKINSQENNFIQLQ